MTKKKANKRSAKVTRSTKETDIRVELTIEGKGKSAITTSIPFMDHMLTLMAAHGFFDLTLDAKGDVEIDEHHTVEDIGIVLGEAFDKALGDRKGMKRYGRGLVPMDEALFRAFVNRSGATVHINLMYGENTHHIIEAVFKAFSQGLDEATMLDDRITKVRSTKGIL